MRGAAALAAAALLAGGCGREPVTIEIPEDARVAKADAFARPLGAALSVGPARADEAYLRAWLSGFTSVTPENALKWEVVEPRRAQRTYAEADAIVEAAETAGKRVRGHTLLWDQQIPHWLATRRWRPSALETVVRGHVRDLVERYAGRIDQWDVVNEPLEDDGSLTRSVFERVLGERFIDIAFDEARRAAPKAELVLNEIGAERPGPKQDALVALTRRLRTRGVPIDGVGLQNHTTVGDAPTRAQLAATIRRFAELGLTVEITEMDVALPRREITDALLDRQAAVYEDAARACADADACTGLTVWGVTDRYSWLGPERSPLPYDAHAQPKPALRALRAVLARD